MPDWSYRTVFQPLLFRLPPAAARDLCLGVIGALGGSPAGSFVIDFLGHMRPDARLARTIQGTKFRTVVGLGCGIDVENVALAGLARFGFGFVEVGPVTAHPRRRDAGGSEAERLIANETIAAPYPPNNQGAESLAAGLVRSPTPGIRRFARLVVSPEASALEAVDEIRLMTGALAHHVSVMSIDVVGARTEWDEASCSEVLDVAVRNTLATRSGCDVWLVILPDLDPVEAERLVRLARAAGVRGVMVDGSVQDRDRPGWRRIGRLARGPSIAMVRRVRAQFGADLAIAASGGVHEPADALDLLEAGADLVAIDSGLVYAGPGLPKRVNDALIHAGRVREPEQEIGGGPEARPAELSWFWLFLLGVSMLVGSTIALAVAATRVVLPYDEHFVGMSRGALDALNPRLLPFMSHDRVTLAGTMVTIGAMYCGLSWFGIRRGLHWALVAVIYSASAGFASFFLFLGFGYFDPFHAFVTSVLLQLLLLGVHSRLGPPAALPTPDLHNDARWRSALWGQLLFIAQASAFVVAGLVISFVGVTSVFVPEDLEYLGTTARELSLVNPRVPALVAHDRASFGGMLVASGLVFLTSALWGFRKGARWLWWTTLLSGAPGYAAAIGVHFAVGYENLWHLAPAFAGLAIFLTGLALTYPYLCQSDPALEAEWSLRHRPGPASTQHTGTPSSSIDS
jgi:dihydroorotate dehydrogenase